MKHKTKPTPLTADTVADERALVVAIDALLIEPPEMVRHRRNIIRQQNGLRRVADDRVWRAYHKVEEAVNGRYDLALRLVAAWAFEQGRKCP